MTRALSPAQTAPTEILLEIFKLSLPSSADPAAIGMFLDASPWVLGRICTRWRAIALDMPSLWKTLVVLLPYGSASRPIRAFSVNLVAEYLRRSRSHPLKIVFSSQEQPPALTTHMLFLLISTTSHRWETLELDISLPLLVQPLRGKLPLLRKLSLCCNRALSCRGRDEREDGLIGLLDEVIPWEQLAEYRTVHDDPLSFQRLHATKDLVEFQCVVRETPTRPLLVTRFQNLRKLALTIDVDELPTYRYLDSLVLPVLEDLYIDDTSLTLSPLIVSLLARSGCSLRKLWLNVIMWSDDFAAVAEKNLRDLEELGLLQAAHSVDTIIRRLVITPGVQPLLPKLRTLHVLNDYVFFILLVEMLESRAQHGVPLHTVSMPLPLETMSEPLIPRLGALLGNGLDIQLKRRRQDPNVQRLTYF